MKKLVMGFVAFLALSVPAVVAAQVAVVVHPSASFDSLSEDDVARLFLGKSKSFPDGAIAIAVNQNEGSVSRIRFTDLICKKNASQYKAYWSQLVFTGKGAPPPDAGDDMEVKALIAANPNMIGYVDMSAVDASVKVVYSTL